jgi:PKD repeat protein
MNNILVSLLIGGVLVSALAGHGAAVGACPFGAYSGGGFISPFGDPGSGDSDIDDPFSSTEDPASNEAPCPFGDTDSGSTGEADPFSSTEDPASNEAPCPFGDGDSGSTGEADPFSSTDDSASNEAPCPFGDAGSEGTGEADPFSSTDDPASNEAPCPFPRSVASSETVSQVTGHAGETYPAPGDPDGDGFYEDLNGNGWIDFADLILYFNTIDWIRENQPLCCFDYDGNGAIDFIDAILLMDEI